MRHIRYWFKKKKFGPVQLMWLDNLEKYPERQTKNYLGYTKNDTFENCPDEYKACCLGELLLCGYRKGIIENLDIDPLSSVQLNDGSFAFLNNSWNVLGLRDKMGIFKYPVTIAKRTYVSLISMNESGRTWPEIATYVRDNPWNVFRKDV